MNTYTRVMQWGVRIEYFLHTESVLMHPLALPEAISALISITTEWSWHS